MEAAHAKTQRCLHLTPPSVGPSSLGWPVPRSLTLGHIETLFLSLIGAEDG